MKTLMHVFAFIGGLMGVAFLLCAAVGHLMGDTANAVHAFLILGGILLLAAFAAWRIPRAHNEIKRKDAFLLVVSSGLMAGLIGSLPYLALAACRDLPSAFFESMSGFTTTGASVLSKLETLPRSLLFWRSLTHFFGGAGILVIFIAILPFAGAGGVPLLKAESTGLFSAKLIPRMTAAARIVLEIYLLLNLACTLALLLGGMALFDAACHAFGTMATGGFSTRSASIAAFDSVYIEWVIVLFMFLAGTNFVLHFQALRGNFRGYPRNSEWKFYLAITVGISLVTALLIALDGSTSLLGSLRHAVFQTVSLSTTTGYTTADYNLWPSTVKLLFLTLMILGASSGSTAGGIKSVRIVVMAKSMYHQLLAVVQPSRIKAFKLDRDAIATDRVEKAQVYALTYLVLLLLSVLLLIPCFPDLPTCTSAVIACLGNVGPGIAGVGPGQTYAQVPGIAKLLLSLIMGLGRLEIIVCLVIFTPGFWKK